MRECVCAWRAVVCMHGWVRGAYPLHDALLVFARVVDERIRDAVAVVVDGTEAAAMRLLSSQPPVLRRAQVATGCGAGLQQVAAPDCTLQQVAAPDCARSPVEAVSGYTALKSIGNDTDRCVNATRKRKAREPSYSKALQGTPVYSRVLQNTPGNSRVLRGT